jgi:crotonobetainyl-CoA:carnitine CoA-transferase CaiB-like acyl-CoA transferase/nucleoside-diphosphate-sugar epimerase
VRVLDAGVMLAGPLVGRIFGDLGAEVINLESPGGDSARGVPPGGDEVGNDFWHCLHRDQRSVAVNLKEPEGLAVVRALLPSVDVLVENFRPGVMDRLGLGAADVRASNPSLVYCSVTGFGPDGPLARMPATDGVIQAFTGWSEPALRLDGSLGAAVSNTVADYIAGLCAAQAVTAALVRRQSVGEGAHVEVSMVECMVYARSLCHAPGLLSPSTFVATTSDGKQLLVQTALGLASRLLAVISREPGSEDLLDRPELATKEGRAQHADDYLGRMRQAIARRPLAQWLEIFGNAGVPAAPVLDLEEALDHPQIADRGGALTIRSTDGRTRRVPHSPFRFDGTRWSPPRAATALGADTADVLRELAGDGATPTARVAGSDPGGDLMAGGRTALVVGGSGQTGPLIVAGLLERGYEVVVLHGGQHEHPDLPVVEHIHVDPHFIESLEAGLAGRTFDLAIGMYGRTRLVAQALVGRAARFIAISGTAHAYFDQTTTAWGPLGQTVVDESSPYAESREADPLSFAVAATEAKLLEQHARGDFAVTIIRFPEVYGPDSLVGRDWSIVRRILDRRPHFIVADGGLRVSGRLYRDNAAHAVLLVVDRPDEASGEVFTAADSTGGVTHGQIVDYFARVLGHEWELVGLPTPLAEIAYPDLCGYHRIYDNTKIVSRLGYADRVGAAEALETTARWWAENPPERGGALEQRMGDMFDYDTEDRLIAMFKATMADALSRDESGPIAGHAYRHPRAVGEGWVKDTSERLVEKQRDPWPFPLWRPA